MNKKYILLAVLLFAAGPVFSQQWRSSLYPQNWKPGMQDSEGRFLHDFSYAGYHRGEQAIPDINKNVVDVTKAPYAVDNTGKADATAAIQQALNDVGQRGGGVVYLPAGKYKLDVSAAKANPLRISYSNVVLRGAGAGKTFIFNDNSNVRNVSIIQAKPTAGGNWLSPEGKAVSITADLLLPTQTIPVSSVQDFMAGDWVVLRTDVTKEFITEHNMDSLWATSLTGTMFYRYITAVDKQANTIQIDAPTRYFLKKRDHARVYKVRPVLSEVGIEGFSIANRQSTLPGLGGLDFNVKGTAAYEVHSAHLLMINSAINCWIRNISTYRPEENKDDIHLVSSGILLQNSRFVTVDACSFQKTQYLGEGGNGYMYTLASNDCLIRNCFAGYARHNYDFKSMRSNGNVILRCRGENSTLASDFHMHLSMSNLFDNTTLNKDFLEAKFRPWGTFPEMHGYPTTQSVYWNTVGEAYPAKVPYIIDSEQFGWGYIIGTSGPANEVKTSPTAGRIKQYDFDSAPEDFKEGIGKGESLLPKSLYLDQLERRLKAHK
ncbi:glycoside hydrolase family 55 protein [Hymenobacter sp. 5317J-9]|uniref:glycoside hydrolase family 55 protein n=1 Tax=Hymenobacter sp. 5317J-9 TaxID=2932250 RepID=UPI001FD718C6|nr:glycoside hydrolase family 55 protein [Hymenobacter sp. 5317J-9]UOQ98703.1 glycoside hydrolase family 55 protein [Hymenobacter sp. 5317J-9]